MGFYTDKVYNHFLAGQLRAMDVDEDLKQYVEVMALTLDEFDQNITDFQSIWDIDLCPKKYLPYIAQMIGWSFGPEDTEAEMRNQLRLAIPFYKKKGLEESFRILCYSYGLLVDVIPLWSDDYLDFVPHPGDPFFPNDTPPDALRHSLLGGTGTLYPTPHIGIELTAVIGPLLDSTRFYYILNRIHDIRPAHVVLDWWHFSIEMFDFVDVHDEDENYIDINFKDVFPLGCFWRGKDCNPVFYRDGTIADRHGPGGFFPTQDYTTYPPPLPTDPYSPEVGVDMTPDAGSPMDPNFPFGGVHVRNPDEVCPWIPTRSSFDYDLAYHLRDGSSFMRRVTSEPPGPYFFRDGQFLTTCNQDNTPWLAVTWSSQYDADLDVPDVETPPWVLVPPAANPPTVTVVNGLLNIVHDYGSGDYDLQGWEIKTTDDVLGTPDFDLGYVFDALLQVNEAPPTKLDPASSIPARVQVVGTRTAGADKRKFSIDVFKDGFRKSDEPMKWVPHDFSERTLLRVVIKDEVVQVLLDGQLALWSEGTDWLPVEGVAPSQVRFTVGPMMSAGHNSDVSFEWVRLLLDDEAYGPGRDYWTEYHMQIWQGWCCPPEDPMPGSPLRYYCCKDDFFEIIPFGEFEEGFCSRAIRDGVSTAGVTRSGYGGYKPLQDYSVYPPALPTDPYTPDLSVNLTPDTGNPYGDIRDNWNFVFSRGCCDPLDLDQDGPATLGWDPFDASAYAEFPNPGCGVMDALEIICAGVNCPPL